MAVNQVIAGYTFQNLLKSKHCLQECTTTDLALAWAVSQHVETSKETKAWAVSQDTDTSKNTKDFVVSQH